MFQKNELAHLQVQKDLLVLQSSANRLLLAAEWQRLRSPEHWLDEAGRLVRRHPLLTAALATATGVLAVQAVRKPGGVVGGIGRIGKLASMAFAVWKFLRRGKSQD